MTNVQDDNKQELRITTVEYPVHQHGAITYYEVTKAVEKLNAAIVEYPVHYHGAIKYYNTTDTETILRTERDVFEQYGELADTLGI